MNNSNDNTTRPDEQDEITVLGVASVETKGGAGMRIEDLGFVTAPGISDD